MFLYLLKNVEIVIILIYLREGIIETTSFKSFGESVAHILCALFVGGDEFRDSIYCIYIHIYNQFINIK